MIHLLKSSEVPPKYSNKLPTFSLRIFLTVGSNTKFQYFLARFPDSELVLIFLSLSYFFFSFKRYTRYKLHSVNSGYLHDCASKSELNLISSSVMLRAGTLPERAYVNGTRHILITRDTEDKSDCTVGKCTGTVQVCLPRLPVAFLQWVDLNIQYGVNVLCLIVKRTT